MLTTPRQILISRPNFECGKFELLRIGESLLQGFPWFFEKNVKNFKNLVDKVKLSVIVYLSCRKTEKTRTLKIKD